MKFEEEFPSLNNLQELISFDKKRNTITIPLNIFKSCLRDEQKIKEAIEAAVHGVMFKGYDENSEKALIEMQNYIYEELRLK